MTKHKVVRLGRADLPPGNQELSGVLHELAEALQSTANYMRAAQLTAAADTMHAEMIDKALDELGRVNLAFHEYIRHVSGNHAHKETFKLKFAGMKAAEG